jgi:hypothetical protein
MRKFLLFMLSLTALSFLGVEAASAYQLGTHYSVSELQVLCKKKSGGVREHAISPRWKPWPGCNPNCACTSWIGCPCCIGPGPGGGYPGPWPWWGSF